MVEHRHLKRLDRVWAAHPVYFITVCTQGRRPVLATPESLRFLQHEWESARQRHGWLIGRYVVMPDHVHFFCVEQAEGAKHPLSRFVGGWKEWTAKGILGLSKMSGPLWQEEFFDHVLRSDESYAEKWEYVRENPVRAELVMNWADWSYQGFVDFDFPRSM